MSSFKNESSKARAVSSVNRLLQNYLPGSEEVGAKNKASFMSSGAAIINQKISRKDLAVKEEQVRKSKLKQKMVKKKQIAASLRDSKNISTVVKLDKLRKEQKYSDPELQEEISKKLSVIKSWENTQKKELKQLQREILSLKDHNTESRKKVKQKNQRKADFNRKLQKGIVAYPGLTPGLAPVDLTDGEDSD